MAARDQESMTTERDAAVSGNRAGVGGGGLTICQSGVGGGLVSGEARVEGGIVSGEERVDGGRVSGEARVEGERESGEAKVENERVSGEARVEGGRVSGEVSVESGMVSEGALNKSEPGSSREDEPVAKRLRLSDISAMADDHGWITFLVMTCSI